MSRKKKKRLLVSTPASRERERDISTVKELNEALDENQDLSRLRKLAAVRGLVNGEVRARLWVTLAGADPAAVARPDYEAAAAGAHRDRGTVEVDVARSLWALMPGARDEEREEKRVELARLLNAVVVHHGGDVHYYQGLHDVASVLLLVAGERAAFAILCRLVTGPLRDATRPTLDPVLELLGLMGPVLEAADPELASLAADVGLPPYYALSWFITWFAHDVPGPAPAARLFDLFLATHPLMPLYVGASAMASQRLRLLEGGRGEGGMPALHSALTNLDVTRALGADQLACRAIQLFRKLPPEAILARRSVRIAMAVAPRAFQDKVTGMWRVPEPSKGALTGGGGSGKQAQWQQQLQQAITKLVLPGGPPAPPARVLLSLGVYTAFVAMLWAVARLQQAGGVGGGGFGGGGGGGLPWT